MDPHQVGLAFPTGGSVVAVLHYGNFVPTVVSLALSAPPDRRVLIFYDAPFRASSNRSFDDLALKTIPRLGRDISIGHNDAPGLARAVRVLRSGGAVIIMPDVCRDAMQGLAIPFLGRAFVAAPGTARLAERMRVPLISVLPSATAGQPHFTRLEPRSFETREPMSDHSREWLDSFGRLPAHAIAVHRL